VKQKRKIPISAMQNDHMLRTLNSTVSTQVKILFCQLEIAKELAAPKTFSISKLFLEVGVVCFVWEKIRWLFDCL